MYYNIYTSDDHAEYYIENNNPENNNQYNEKCLICFESSDFIVNMKDVNNIITNCHCNSKFHKKCLVEWIKKTYSCPICRKKAWFINDNDNDNYTNNNKTNNNITNNTNNITNITIAYYSYLLCKHYSIQTLKFLLYFSLIRNLLYFFMMCNYYRYIYIYELNIIRNRTAI